MTPKIQDPFVLWIALQAKGSIPIRHLRQQQDPKENHFCKWVFMREDAHIWVVPLRLSPTTTPKIQDPFILWVALQAKGSIPIRHLLQR